MLLCVWPWDACCLPADILSDQGDALGYNRLTAAKDHHKSAQESVASTGSAIVDQSEWKTTG